MVKGQPQFDDKGPYLWALVQGYSNEVCTTEVVERLMCCGDLTAWYEFEMTKEAFEHDNGGDPCAYFELRKMYVDFGDAMEFSK